MGAPYYGDYPTSAVWYMVFDSFAASTGAPSAVTNFAAGDIQIYKDGGTTQRSSSAGITVTTSFDSNTGLQMVAIDTSDNTDAGFYAAGHEYSVAVADITVDAQTLRFWLGTASIERSGGALALLKAGTAKVTLADGVAHGGTLGSSTATLALSRLNVTSQTSNTVAITATGNGTGSGIVATSGSGATGDGIQATSAATNGNGLVATGVGTGNGLKVVSASGDAISAVAATSGHGFTATGAGTTKHGINATGGSTTSHGINATGGGVGHGILATSGGGATGDGIKAVSAATNGNGFNLVGNGTGNGLLTTGGAGAGGDGLEAAAGGGVPIRGDHTGNITGNLSGSVGSVTGAVGSVTAAVTLSAGDSPVLQSGTAAAGGASTITIASAIGADSRPVGCTVKITSGTGSGQARVITAYVDATKVVTVDRAWTTTPDNTSVYSILFTELAALSSGLKTTGVVLTDTVTTYTGNTVQTGDSYARIGANGAGLTSVGVGTGGIAAASFAASAIDAAAIATDAIGSAELAAGAVTKIWANSCTEPTAVVAASPTAIAALSWLNTLSRNRIEQTATTQTVKADDGTTTIATATVSDDGTTAVRAEFS